MANLLFFATIVFIIYSIVSAIRSLQKEKVAKAKTKLIQLSLWLFFYGILLIGFSLVSKEEILSLNEDTCFDDWCVAIASVSSKTTENSTIDYYVNLRVSSKARRVSQRPDHPNIFMVDSFGKHIEHTTVKSQFEAENGKQRPINDLIQPQSSYDTVMVFRTSKDATNKKIIINEGSFPVQLMIGDRESFLHKDTIFEIQ